VLNLLKRRQRLRSVVGAMRYTFEGLPTPECQRPRLGALTLSQLLLEPVHRDFEFKAVLLTGFLDPGDDLLFCVLALHPFPEFRGKGQGRNYAG
jgi:hypothetical protein